MTLDATFSVASLVSVVREGDEAGNCRGFEKKTTTSTGTGLRLVNYEVGSMREKPEALALNMAEMLERFGGLTQISSKHAKQIAVELRRLYARAQELEAEAAAAESYARTLTMAIFKKHYAHEDCYASGAVKFELFDSTAGMLTQIDNMVAGLERTKGARDD